MADKINIVLLAAGKGTRLNLNIPKPLCPFMGRTLLDFVVSEVIAFCEGEGLEVEIDLIVGHQKDLIETHISNEYPDHKINFIHQERQLGTGHALQVYFEKKEKLENQKYTLVMCADTPLLKQSIFKQMYQRITSSDSVGIAATFETNDPTGYGRIIKHDNGFEIVEEKDANNDQRKIKEVNSALYFLSTEHIKKHIFNLTSENNSKEFYLTDLFKPEFAVEPILFEDKSFFEGINNLSDLEEVERKARQRKLIELRQNGVRIIDSNATYVDNEVEIGKGSVLYPGVFISGKSVIGEGCIIEPNCMVKQSKIGDGVHVLAGSYIEEASVGNHCHLGPYARLRPGTTIAEECKIGNFVETKKANLDKGVKVSHLSYVGDAEIGENTNIGCGFITCNYDGKNKHLTKIGKDSFIGSDCQMIAPVELGDRVYVGSGSTINKDVPSDGFAIARERQVTKPGMASRFLKKKD